MASKKIQVSTEHKEKSTTKEESKIYVNELQLKEMDFSILEKYSCDTQYAEYGTITCKNSESGFPEICNFSKYNVINGYPIAICIDGAADQCLLSGISWRTTCLNARIFTPNEKKEIETKKDLFAYFGQIDTPKKALSFIMTTTGAIPITNDSGDGRYLLSTIQKYKQNKEQNELSYIIKKDNGYIVKLLYSEAQCPVDIFLNLYFITTSGELDILSSDHLWSDSTCNMF